MNQAVYRWVLVVLMLVAVAGCATRSSAPVIDRTASSGRPASPPSPAVSSAATATARSTDNRQGPDAYAVRRGDTLYSIALDHGLDYRDLARWNNLDNPSVIRVDQVLRLRDPGAPGAPAAAAVQVRPIAGPGGVETRPLGPSVDRSTDGVKSEPRAVKLPYTEKNLALLSREPKPVLPATAARPALELKPSTELKPVLPPQAQAVKPPAESDDDEKVDWGWPTTGAISVGYSDNINKGFDIVGKTGQPVLASASGTVSYVGSGIRGYGKFIVIRHNKTYLTVYAHNDSILVKEGQHVVKGQKVAEMGKSDTDQVKLHFEIRRLGKPVDPAKFLPNR